MLWGAPEGYYVVSKMSGEKGATPKAKQRHSEGGNSVYIGSRSQWLEAGVVVRRAKEQPLGKLGTGAVKTWKDRFVLV